MSEEDFNPPMGCLHTWNIGEKKLTLQTEFFPRPQWRIETKVYLAGALKKVYTQEVGAADKENLQQLVNQFHDEKLREIEEGLLKKKTT